MFTDPRETIGITAGEKTHTLREGHGRKGKPVVQGTVILHGHVAHQEGYIRQKFPLIVVPSRGKRESTEHERVRNFTITVVRNVLLGKIPFLEPGKLFRVKGVVFCCLIASAF